MATARLIEVALAYKIGSTFERCSKGLSCDGIGRGWKKVPQVYHEQAEKTPLLTSTAILKTSDILLQFVLSWTVHTASCVC